MVRVKWATLLIITIVINSITQKANSRDFDIAEGILTGNPTISQYEDFENSQADNMLQIDFNFPEMVSPGDVFMFEFVIKKQAQHSIGGKFRFTWPRGFVPVLPESDKAIFSVVKNDMVVEWNAQTFSDDVAISYPVQVNNVASGVYPILSVLTVIGGLQIEKNTKIRVDVNKSGNFPQHTINATLGTFSLVLEYPREVVSGSQYNLAVKIRKNTSTAKAALNLSVPPFSDLQVVDYENYEYDKNSGRLRINWKNLPETSEISLTCRITSSGISKAVYPISAELFVDEKSKAVFSNSIYISEKAMVSSAGNTSKAKSDSPAIKSDSLKLYAEMDELLNQWKNATKIVTVETGKNHIKNEPAQPDLTQKSDKAASVEIKQFDNVKKEQPEQTQTNQNNTTKTTEQPEETKQVSAIETIVDSKNDSVKTREQNPDNALNQVAGKAENKGKELLQAEKPVLKDTGNEGNKTYKVQVGASKAHLTDIKSFVRSLGFYETVVEDFDGTWYRYFVGEFSQLAEAKDFNKALIEKGMADSFVVTFIDGKRVPAN